MTVSHVKRITLVRYLVIILIQLLFT